MITVRMLKKAKAEKSLCLLPTILPPDQLLFEFMYNLDKEDSYWQKNNGFTKVVFLKISADIIEKLNIVEEKYLYQMLSRITEKVKVRKVLKES